MLPFAFAFDFVPQRIRHIEVVTFIEPEPPPVLVFEILRELEFHLGVQILCALITQEVAPFRVASGGDAPIRQ
jgi:hypothetical protein